MAIKQYSTFPKAPGQEPHHQMQFSVYMGHSLYLTHRDDTNWYYHSGKVDLRVMAMKRYSTFPKAPGYSLGSYAGHLLRDVLPLCRDAVGLSYTPNRQNVFVRLKSAAIKFDVDWLLDFNGVSARRGLFYF